MKIQYKKVHCVNIDTYEFTKKDGIYAVLIFLYIITLSFLFGLFVYKSNINKELVKIFSNEQMYKLFTPITQEYLSLIHTGVGIISMFIPLIIIEKELKTKFDENGIPKKIFKLSIPIIYVR